jgi:hypothetical protein
MHVRTLAMWVMLGGATAAVHARSASAQQPCARIDGKAWWQVSATRFFQSSGEGQRISGLVIERHFVDRRALRRIATGYRLEIARTKLGLRDETVNVAVEYGPNGAVTRITGDTSSLSRDVAPLLMLNCGELLPGRTLADVGGRVDTVRTDVQRGITRAVPARQVTLSAIDSLGERLLLASAQRVMTDTTRGDLVRRQPNMVVDTLKPWTALAGEEIERQFVRVSDGTVVFRERTRKLNGRGWVPPHTLTDTVAIRVDYASVERVVDSATAAGVLNFSRRGDVSVSKGPRDTIALHYREWRGDTLIVRQFRRTGWRDELRTVWRDSTLAGALLTEPGTATQAPGMTRRGFQVQRGFLKDAGSRDSAVATPQHAWAIALDGFEDALVPALTSIAADSQPHRFSMYGINQDRGAWLNWSVTIVPRGAVRVARFYTLQRQWVGSFVFTPSGELLIVTLGGPQGVSRLPAAGSRLAGVLEAQRGKIQKEDIIPASP